MREFAGRSRESEEAGRIEPLMEQNFDARPLPFGAGARQAPSPQPRRDHLGVVDDHQIAAAQKVRQIADMGVLERAVRVNDQQPRGFARARGPQSNALVGQVEIEQRHIHGSGQ